MAAKLLRVVATGLALAVALSLISSGGTHTLAQPPVPSKDAAAKRAVSRSDQALSKMDPTLRSLAREGGEELTWLQVFVRGGRLRPAVNAPEYWRAQTRGVWRGTDLSRYMEPGAITRTILGRTQILGQVRAANLVKLASHEGVVAVLGPHAVEPPPPIVDPDVPQKRDIAPQKIRERVAAIRAAGDAADRNMFAAAPDAPRVGGGRAEPAAAASMAPTGWWDVSNGHKSAAAWVKGFTGQGVKVADIDSGVDFAHPDLQGTWAVLDDPESPYDGWPIAFDPNSMFRYALFDPDAQGDTWYADTRTTCTGASCTFQPDGAVEPHDYVLPGTSKSGVYHIGNHPDTSLDTWWYGERVAVLVVDENTAGVYDTVYVDLDADYDFTDEKPATKADPISWKDNWDSVAMRPGSDGYPDLSGGMIYYIADGTHYVPAFDWLWLPSLSSPPPVPGPGDMVAFMINDPFGAAGNHGQFVASAIAGQGVIDGGAPLWKPPASRVGGIDQGGGRDAKIIAVGNFYDAPFPTDSFDFAVLGYDGVPGTGDEADIASNSWGFTWVDNDGWDFLSRYATWLNETVAPTLSWLFSTGNGAPGYGTVAPPSPVTGLGIGASTQYGSTGTFDSISTVDQINWGDVMSWSNSGPGALGDGGVSVVANGAWGAGALPLNEWGDGWTAWESWGGTSRAAPIAAGNLALIYDAYKQANGEFPTSQVARELLMSGATDIGYNAIRQGAGLVNADRATDVAGGLYGVWISPSEWSAGDYRGTEYPGFARIIQAGGSDTQIFTVYNPSSVDITVDLTDAYVVQMGNPIPMGDSIQWSFSSKNQSREDGSFTKPDYLFDFTAQIPPDADLMEVKLIQLYEEFSPSAPQSDDLDWDSRWRLLIYDWTDTNGDGDLWTDDNGDGIVNRDEIDGGEYIRFNYGYNTGTAVQAVVHHPANRYHDGLFIGVRHRDGSSRVPNTWLRLRVTFYKRVDWPWLTTDVTTLTVPAGGSAAFDATVTVPADAQPGFYEGLILVQDPGDGSHDPHTSAMPVTVNVAAAGTDFSLGGAVEGTPDAERPVDAWAESGTPYDNSHLFGFFHWSGRPDSGDWRFFFTDVPDDHGLLEGTAWLAHTTWDTLPTDVDTLIMGPTSDDFSDPEGPSYVPDTYGPYTLETVGGSENRYIGSGKWQFHTTSGATEDWVTAPLDAGLHLFALHNVLFSGKEMEESFKVDVGTISVTPTEMVVDDAPVAGMGTLTIQSSLDLLEFTADAFGLSKPDEFLGLPVIQDKPFDPATSSYLFQYTVEHGGFLEASIHSVASDVDLFLLYDADADGTFDFNTEVIGSSTSPEGDEYVSLTLPDAGDYLVAVHGWRVVSGDTVDVVINIVQGRDLVISGVPHGAVAGGTSFDINVHWAGLTPGSWQGIITLGPVDGPMTLVIPVTLNRLGQEVVIAAAPDDTGYVTNSELLTNRFGGGEMRTGTGTDSRKYHGAFQFDLSSIPVEAEILTAQVELTGANERYMSDYASGAWSLGLLGSNVDFGWAGLGYWQIAGATVEEAVGAAATDADLGVGVVNTFTFSQDQIAALQARLDTTGKASFRMDFSVVPSGTRHLYAWDGGSGAAPVLRIAYVVP